MELAEIGKIAFKHTKMTKDETFILVKDIIGDLPWGDVDPVSIAQLFNFFIPHPETGLKKDHKEPKRWVALAMDNNIPSYREMDLIFVQDGKAVATDGYRMHIINTDEENGFYDGNFKRLEDQNRGDWVPWKSVLPVYKEGKKVFLKDLPGSINENGTRTVTIDDVTLSYNLLAQAIGEEEAEIQLDGPKNAVRIDYKGRVAVIMPIVNN